MQRVLGKLAAAKGEPVPVPTAAPAAQPDDDMIICRCEEITKGQIRQAIKDGLATLNGVKRVTRAGMGLCQGQTCGRLVAGILARELGLKPGELDPTTARAPNRPVPMSVFAQG
ncbi:MAG: (2Fe-2S)-binding protein [Deltaproteobacteria bacterium]|nr:(2Fe-2S)-binding protein [Deltaproteobacteria bacterium]